MTILTISVKKFQIIYISTLQKIWSNAAIFFFFTKNNEFEKYFIVNAKQHFSSNVGQIFSCISLLNIFDNS